MFKHTNSGLERELNEVKRALYDVQERCSLLERESVTQGDLQKCEYVTKDQIRDIIRDENRAMENKFVALTLDVKEQSYLPSQFAKLKSVVEEVKSAKTTLGIDCGKNATALTQQGARIDGLNACLERNILSIEYTRQDLELHQNDIRMVHQAFFGKEDEEQDLGLRVQKIEDNLANLQRSHNTMNKDISRLCSDESQRAQAVIAASPLSDQDIESRVRSSTDKMSKVLRDEQSEVRNVPLGELEKIWNCQNRLQETVDNNISVKIADSDRKLANIEHLLSCVMTFVRGQQKKFDCLTGTQAGQSLLGFMAHGNTYHPCNIVRQLHSPTRDMLKPHPATDDIIQGFPSVRKQAQDASVKAVNLSTAVDSDQNQLNTLTEATNVSQGPSGTTHEPGGASIPVATCATPAHDTEEDRPLMQTSSFSNSNYYNNDNNDNNDNNNNNTTTASLSKTASYSRKRDSEGAISSGDEDQSPHLLSKRTRRPTDARRNNISNGGL
ncbi:MAG: hypothetical protein Q9163_005316 [Psora crenata]